MFCTVSDVATFLGLTIAANDPQVTQAIAEVTAVIQNYCHQAISVVADDEVTFDGGQCGRLYLPELPVTSVSSVVEDDVTLVDGIDYKLGNHGILYRINRDWSAGIRNIVVIYSHGYAAIPEDVKGIAYRSAARVYQAQLRAKQTDGVTGVAQVSVGDYSVSFEADRSTGDESQKGVSAARTLLLSEKDVLNKYRYLGQTW